MFKLGTAMVVVVCGILSVAFAGNACRQEMKRRGYIPDYADGVKYTNVKVSFEGQRVECGAYVSVLVATKAPTLKLDLTRRCKNVTILEISPDSIYGAPYLTWLVHNVNSQDLKNGFSNGGGVQSIADGNDQGDVKASYITKKDPTGGIIRKTTRLSFIYCQCQYIGDKKLVLTTDRINFDVKKYTREHGLNCPAVGFFHELSYTGFSLPTTGQVPDPAVPLPTLPGSNLPGDNLPPTVKKGLGPV